MEYKLICPNCGDERIYSSNAALWLAKKTKSTCRRCNAIKNRLSNSSLEILLKDTYESWYWVGFLLADGNIHNHRLRLCISEADLLHLLRYCNYVGLPIKFAKNNVYAVQRNVNVSEGLLKKFDFKENKTYNPPNFIIPNNEYGWSLIAGFIDGDGHIKNQYLRNDFFITVKLHSSWKSFIEQMNLIISSTNTTKINNAGYAIFTISNTHDIIEFKKKLNSLNLPLLSRKWDIVDESFVSKYTVAKNRIESAFEMFNKGCKNVDVEKELQLSPACISKYRKKWIH